MRSHNDRAALYALGHYAGTVTELAGHADRARGAAPPRRRAGRRACRRSSASKYPGDAEHLLADLNRAVKAIRGDEPALEATEPAAQPRHAARSARMADRRMFERAFLFRRMCSRRPLRVAAACGGRAAAT